MAKKPKTKQKAEPDDRVLRFFRGHWAGVVAVALFAFAVGWLAWHVRYCLTYQKLQLAKARAAWTKARIASQKSLDSDDAMLTRATLLKQDATNGVPSDTLKLHRQAILDFYQTYSNDCIEFQSSIYELSREVNALGREFSFKVDVGPEDEISTYCKGLSDVLERLRTPLPGGRPFPHPDFLAHYDTLYSETLSCVTNRKQSAQKATSELNALFAELEEEGFVSRVRHCLW